VDSRDLFRPILLYCVILCCVRGYRRRGSLPPLLALDCPSCWPFGQALVCPFVCARVVVFFNCLLLQLPSHQSQQLLEIPQVVVTLHRHAPQVLVEHDLDTVVLVEQGVVVLALLALHPALAGVVIEGSAALAASWFAAKVGDAARLLGVAEAVLVPHRCAVVPPLTPPRPVPPLLVSDEKTLTSTHVSSPLSPDPISAMLTTWPSLKSLNCLLRVPFALSPSTVCVVATTEMALYQAVRHALWRRL
jgi:hypothetical protein